MGNAKRICNLVLRLLALSATLSAVIVMASSHEKASVFIFSFEAKFNQVPAFKYFVIANVVASLYGFIVLFLPQESLLWRLVVVLDVIMTMLLTSSISAALAIAYVGKNGNYFAGWLPVCGQFPKYCDHVAGALIAGFIGILIYGVLVLSSIHSALDPLLLGDH